MRNSLLRGAVAVVAIVVGGSALADPQTPVMTPAPYVAGAVADPARPQADRDLDAVRKPVELLTFVGIKPGQTVVDVFPGAYFDRLFAGVVGPAGKVYMYIPTEFAKVEKIDFPADGSHPFGANVTVKVAPTNDFAIPGKADVVWIRQNYHDIYDPFMKPADVPTFDKAVFKALRHGGIFVVVDHAAPDGSGLAATNTTHRIDAAVVKKDMEAVGFKFVRESDLYRNPADPRTKLVFDPSIRGHTDQFIYVFRKP